MAAAFFVYRELIWPLQSWPLIATVLVNLPLAQEYRTAASMSSRTQSRHPKGLALEVTLPRRTRGFECGIDNPEEGTSPAPGQRGLFGRTAASEKFTKSPSLRAALRNDRAKSGRRFDPYAHPELIQSTPGSALAQQMTEMELSDFIMFGGPVSARTRSSGCWSSSSSSSTSPADSSSSSASPARRGRVPRHLRALAQAAEYAASPSPRSAK